MGASPNCCLGLSSIEDSLLEGTCRPGLVVHTRTGPTSPCLLFALLGTGKEEYPPSLTACLPYVQSRVQLVLTVYTAVPTVCPVPHQPYPYSVASPVLTVSLLCPICNCHLAGPMSTVT